MAAIARQRLPGVEVRVADADRLPFAAASFDAVLANMLLPHLAEPERTIAALARVCRPGGRMALTTWDRLATNRHHGVVWEAIRDVRAVAPPDLPPGPDFFRYSDDEAFAALLEGAGLEHVSVRTIPFAHRFASFDELWRTMVEGTVRTRALVIGQSGDLQRTIRARAEELSRRYLGPDGLELPISVKLGSGVVAALGLTVR
jgi:SAM-dependent methyltransferase